MCALNRHSTKYLLVDPMKMSGANLLLSHDIENYLLEKQCSAQNRAKSVALNSYDEHKIAWIYLLLITQVDWSTPF